MTEINEKWKRFRGSSCYISNYGRVASSYLSGTNKKVYIDIDCDDNIIHCYIKRPRLNIKPTKRHHGYLVVQLYSDGQYKQHYVHRMVAEAFIPNPEKLPTVNHKDGNHLNNKVSNLEWMSYSDNNQHAYDNWLKKGRKGNEVSCYTLDGTLIDTYSSMREAERVNHMGNGTVSKAIQRGWNFNGYFWSKDNSLLPEQVVYLVDKNKRENKESHRKNMSSKVDQYDMDGNFIRTYDSYTDAAKQFNGKGSNISNVVLGKRKSYKEYIWKKHK